ncbi:MAG: DUF1566 domain-containing protein [Desulfamplus sp.]
MKPKFYLFAVSVFIMFGSILTTTAQAVTVKPAVAAGGDYTVLLKEDGTVWACGYNRNGELGNGTETNSSTPVQVIGLTNISAIAAASLHTAALKTDGTVWAWGINGSGQLGNETTTGSTPVKVTGLANVSAIAAGGSGYTGRGHTIALKTDGTVWAWGANEDGQLGNGTTTDSYTPVQVSGLTNISAIAAGRHHTIALKTDGTVWAWGWNQYGQLGNGTWNNSSLTPVQVTGLTNVSAIATGNYHTIALKTDGTVWAWGANEDGQLGNSTWYYTILTPVQVSGLTNVSVIAAGSYYTVAIKTDGTVWAWGSNEYGQLGNGGIIESNTPIQVTGLTNISAIAAGSYHTVALKTDGTIWAWGDNEYGQLGNGTTTDSRTPVKTLITVSPINPVITTQPIPDTGITKCYDNEKEIPCPTPGQDFYGQDGNYSINPMSYTKLDSNGVALPVTATTWAMVRDNVTGLIWENKTDEGSIHDKDNTYTWEVASSDFIAKLNAAKFGGYSDWRLPRITELHSIVDYGTPYSTININYFDNTIFSYPFSYWSSITYAENLSYAWALDFYYGENLTISKSTNNYVRAVRGGQIQSFRNSDNFVINGDGTITDVITGLMWQETKNNATTWKDALYYCENLNLGGYTNWRLPTIKELGTLIDYNRYNPSINIDIFSDNNPFALWSNTTCLGYLANAWITLFSLGAIDDYNGDKDNLNIAPYLNVRAVRNVNSITENKPTATTSPATSITSNFATFNGTINPNGLSTSCYFEYGTTTSYGSKTTSQIAGSGSTDSSVKADITGLTYSTTYHFRLVATNSVGTTNGSDMTFTTAANPNPLQPPSNLTASASETGITLAWTHSPSADTASYRIYWDNGTGTIDYDSTYTTCSCPSNSVNVSLVKQGTYKFGVRAVDKFGNEEQNTNVVAQITVNGFNITMNLDKSIYDRGDNAAVSGSAASSDGKPIVDLAVTIDVEKGGFHRYFTAYTNASGTYSYIFQPSSNEAGTYTVSAKAMYQGLEQSVSASLKILGLLLQPSSVTVDMSMNSSKIISFTLSNVGDTEIIGYTWTITDNLTSDGITATANISTAKTGSAAIPTIPAGGSVPVSLKVTAQAGTPPTTPALFTLNVSSTEGSKESSNISVNLHEALPSPVVTPDPLKAAVFPGQPAIKAITVKNEGFAPMTASTVTVHDKSAYNWITIINGDLGTIEPAESKNSQIYINPTDSVQLGTYVVQLDLAYSGKTMPLYLTVEKTTATDGEIAFKVYDDTGINVSGAEVSLISKEVYLYNGPQGKQEYNNTIKKITDADGYALFENVPVGEYRYAVHAAGHDSDKGEITIEAGSYDQTDENAIKKVMLVTNLVDIDFSVTPITISDVYNVTLNITYATDLVKPTLYAEPSRVDLSFFPEEVYEGIITIKNMSNNAPVTDFRLDSSELDSVNNEVKIVFADGSQLFTKDRLEPKESVQIPFHAVIGNSANAKLNDRNLGNMVATANYIFSYEGKAIESKTTTPIPVFFWKPQDLRIPGISFINDETDGNLNDLEYQGTSYRKSLSSNRDVKFTINSDIKAFSHIFGGHDPIDIINTNTGSGSDTLWTQNFNRTTPLTFKGDATTFDIDGLQEALEDQLFDDRDTCLSKAHYGGFTGRWADRTNDNAYLIPISITTIRDNLITGGGYGGWGSGVPSFTPPSEHGEVKLEIKQKVSLEREAFDAKLSLKPTVSALQNVALNLDIKDSNGKDASSLFFVVVTEQSGIGTLEGGTVSGKSEITWQVIPSSKAGGLTENGLNYTIAASVGHSYNGKNYTYKTAEETITVKPMPKLTIDYKLPYVVMAGKPAKIRVKVTNNGAGAAHNLVISSAQPKILDNPNGIPVGFILSGSSPVAGDSGYQEGSITINFGDIAPGKSVEGYWVLVSSKDGYFVEFSSTMNHQNYLGIELDPLIEKVNTNLVPALGGRITAGNYGSMSAELLQSGVLKGSDSVNGTGAFYIQDIAAGDYKLVIKDSSGDTLLSENITILAGQPTEILHRSVYDTFFCSQQPMSGAPGTTFVQWGEGFTPNSTATLHFENPQGTEYLTISQTVDAIGHFEISYTADWDKPAGIYTWWAVDGVTGDTSNKVEYEILPISIQTINPQSDETFYKNFINPTSNGESLIEGGTLSTIIAADGESRLLLRIAADSPCQVKITEATSSITENGSLYTFADHMNTTAYPASSISINVDIKDSKSGKYFGFAVYRSPKDFDTASSGYDSQLTREVLFYVDASCADSFDDLKITLRRPPIFISHGLWSKPNAAQEGFRKSLWNRFGIRDTNDNIDDYILLNDCEKEHSAHFKNGADKTRININAFLAALRLKGITVTQVDYLGHSMGGIWGRFVVQENNKDDYLTYGNGYIHKLITLDTPHGGSFVADIGKLVRIYLDVSGIFFQESKLIKDILCRLFTCDGAIDDLTTSGCERNLQSISVPSHAITGNKSTDHACDIFNISTLGMNGSSVNIKTLFKVYETMLKVIYRDNECENWIDKVGIPIQSDYVVGLDSQRGGLSGDQLSGHSHIHTSSFYSTPDPGNPNKSLFDLLNKGVNDPAFATGFIASSQLDSRTRMSLENLPDLRVSARETAPLGEIQFFNPINGTSVLPGEQIDIELVLTVSLTLQNMLILTSDPDSDAVELFSPPYTTSVTVPENAYGDFVISVLGSGTDGNLYAASVTLPVINDAVLQSVDVTPQSIYFDLGQTMDISVRGTYSDETVRDLSSAEQGTTYKSSNEAILSVSSDGKITPKAVGVGFVLVTYPSFKPVTIRVQISKPTASVQPYRILTDSSPSLDIANGENIRVYGSNGINILNISSGATVECINFVGANEINLVEDSASDFTVHRSGAMVYFESSSTGTTLKIPAAKTAQTINFNGGVGYDLIISNGKVMLGEQEITTAENQLY